MTMQGDSSAENEVSKTEIRLHSRSSRGPRLNALKTVAKSQNFLSTSKLSLYARTFTLRFVATSVLNSGESIARRCVCPQSRPRLAGQHVAVQIWRPSATVIPPLPVRCLHEQGKH